jgi:peptidoglycan/LPS O-acetylase OafA/YrhL
MNLSVTAPPGSGQTSLPASTPKLQSIQGLRFYAAMMVLIFHLPHVGGTEPPFYLAWTKIYFASGVRLFFEISAFTLMYSTLRYIEQKDWIKIYAIRRFARIAPLFYCFVGLNAVLNYVYFGQSLDWSVVLNLSFLFNFYADTIETISSSVWAGWTIGAEMVFYGFLPLLLGILTGLRPALVFLIVGIMISYAGIVAPHAAPYPFIPVQMAFPTQIQFFAWGVLAYWLYKRWQAPGLRHPRALEFGLVAMFVACVICMSFIHLKPAGSSIALLYFVDGPLYFSVCLLQALFPWGFFSNRFVAFWGERSFSIYLVHGPVLIHAKPLYEWLVQKLGSDAGYFASLALSITIILAISAVTYWAIERPGMRAGARLVAKMGWMGAKPATAIA